MFLTLSVLIPYWGNLKHGNKHLFHEQQLLYLVTTKTGHYQLLKHKGRHNNNGMFRTLCVIWEQTSMVYSPEMGLFAVGSFLVPYDKCFQYINVSYLDFISVYFEWYYHVSRTLWCFIVCFCVMNIFFVMCVLEYFFYFLFLEPIFLDGYVSSVLRHL